MLGADKNPLILIQKHILVVLRQIFFLKIKVIVDFYSLLWVKNLHSKFPFLLRTNCKQQTTLFNYSN